MQGGEAARASPIETAVAAIRVEAASARIAISWTNGSGRGCAARSTQCGPGVAAGNLDIVNLPRITIDTPRMRLPPMPARVGPDCGEAVDE